MSTLFCKDCKHFRPNVGSIDPQLYGLCNKSIKTNKDYLVTGVESQIEYNYASTERSMKNHDASCCEDAKWFEPKEVEAK